MQYGVDNVTAEHIIYAHPAIVIHLTKLFNAMIAHGYMRNNFGTSIIVPLVKDRCGNVSKPANYRAISLSPVFAKLFEACLSGKFGVYLQSRDLQFGFKKHSSCSSAVYVDDDDETWIYIAHRHKMSNALLPSR